jgi:outer membrane immunogenic protein
MRRLFLAAFIAVVAQGAHAADPADMPILRGSFREAPPPTAYRTVWQGFYAGAQAGYGASNMAFGSYNSDLSDQLTANPLVTQSGTLPPWPVLGSISNRNTVFGGFAGYNAQFENVIIGVEGNYLHGTFHGSSFGRNTLLAQTGTNTIRSAVTTSQAELSVSDFGSLRIRGGYTMGDFLPYAFAGIGMGRGETNRNVTAEYSSYDSTTGVTTVGPSYPRGARTNQFLYGFALGAGVDWMLFGGMFLRAEYEYLQFTSSINTSIQTVRAGIGYKF